MVESTLAFIGGCDFDLYFAESVFGEDSCSFFAHFYRSGHVLRGERAVSDQFDHYALVNLVCSVCLIFIMFYGGFGTNMRAARPVLREAALMSSLGVAGTAGAVAVFAHFALSLSWLESFLIGAVISSTDAASVFNILRSQKLALKYHTDSLLEVESGSNDPMSYMLTMAAIALLSGAAFSFPLLLAKQLLIGAFSGSQSAGLR